MLTRPGIGQLSATMARHKDRRRVGKEYLALAVKKDFNAATMIERDVVPKFLYTVHNQGKAPFRWTGWVEVDSANLGRQTRIFG